MKHKAHHIAPALHTTPPACHQHYIYHKHKITSTEYTHHRSRASLRTFSYTTPSTLCSPIFPLLAARAPSTTHAHTLTWVYGTTAAAPCVCVCVRCLCSLCSARAYILGRGLGDRRGAWLWYKKRMHNVHRHSSLFKLCAETISDSISTQKSQWLCVLRRLVIFCVCATIQF